MSEWTASRDDGQRQMLVDELRRRGAALSAGELKEATGVNKRIVADLLRELCRPQVILQQRLQLAMAVGHPAHGLFPGPDLVQRTKHQPGQKRQGDVAPAMQQPVQQFGKTQQSKQTAAGKNYQHQQIQLFDCAKYHRVKPQQQQNEAPGNTRENHGTDSYRTGQKQG